MRVHEPGGDGDDDDADAARLIESAAQRVHELELELLELQKKCLARGTRDVLEQAREIVRRIAQEAADKLEDN